MAAQFLSCTSKIPYLKHLVFGFFIAVYMLAASASSVRAADPYTSAGVPVNQSYDQFVRNIQDTDRTGKPNTDSYIGAIVISRVAYGLLYVLTGDGLTKDAAYSQNTGILGAVGSAFGAVYANPPASGLIYVADMAEKARVVQPAYAQSNNQGFNKLSPLLPFWSAMRNLAYIAYVPILLYVGVMIMLRQKVGQAAISVQQALPKIILSLVLVTFSFAIVGFLIDIMNFIMAIILQYFVSAKLLDANIFENDPYRTNLLKYATNFGEGDWNIIHIANAPGQQFGELLGDVAKKILAKVWDVGIFKAIFGGAVSAVAEVIITLIFVIAVVIALVRTLVALIKAYITIIAMTVLGPILLLIGALPQSSTTGYWFRTLLANLAVFPAVLALFIFAMVIGNVQGVAGPNLQAVANPNGDGWIAPFIGDFAGNSAAAVTAFLSIGTFFLMPEALKRVQDFFKVKGAGTSMFAPAQIAAGIVGGGMANALTKGKYSDWRKKSQEKDKEREQQAEKVS